MNPLNIPTTQFKIVEADGTRFSTGKPVRSTVSGPLVAARLPLMFRHLVPRLASSFRVIAPDLPGLAPAEDRQSQLRILS
jgi:hypothetical protein